MSELQASHIFHIAHEALSNAARHAHAKKVWLSLTYQMDTITLQIEDDGLGFRVPDTISSGHRGLANIQKRASILGAALEIDSAPGRGTRLKLTFTRV